MEEMTFAIEKIIVGLFALPWIVCLFLIPYIFVRGFNIEEVKGYLHKLESETLAGKILLAFILGFAYFLGSASFPIADRVFNEPEKLYIPIVKEDDIIRVETYYEVYCKKHFYETKVLETKINNLEEEYKNYLLNQNKNDLNQALALKDEIHSVYNYQKYTVYNNEGRSVLEDIKIQILILRGITLHSTITIIVTTVLFLILALTSLLLKKRDVSSKVPPILITLLHFYFITWVLFMVIFMAGANGINGLEAEFDKHVIGLYHASLSNDNGKNK